MRQLARDALVNPNTVVKAYRELELIGAVLGRSGSGVFVIEGAVELAQARRLTSTLEAFERAARAALRSGHEAPSLAAVLERLDAERRGAEGSNAQRAPCAPKGTPDREEA